MNHGDTITTSRAVDVIRIPSGEQIQLPEGTQVIITQSLGGSFTLLVPSQAGLYRLSGNEADAIGETPALSELRATGDGQTPEAAVWDILKTCYDPEIPVDIVNLGLIYSCDIQPGDAGSTVLVRMTLTAPGCGMGPVIAKEAEEKISSLPGILSASVEVVWDPPWTPDRITPEGREKLGMA